MRSKPLAAALTVGLFVSSACAGNTSNSEKSIYRLLSEYPAQIEQLLALLALQEKDFELQISNGHVQTTVSIGNCAVIASNKQPTSTADIVPNPAVLSANLPRTNLGVVEQAGYNPIDHKIIFGPPSFIQTVDNHDIINKLPSDFDEYDIVLPNSIETEISASVSKTYGSFLDDQTQNPVFSTNAVDIPASNETFKDFAESDQVAQFCEAGWPKGGLQPVTNA